ncbi:hypothetical protein QJS04_geneDACA022878 [Acorus gramineus]|uniref:Uncharacterized protein n=1 Tax=Acorus gramineus TaxID=55184 RepID=A0AAV9AZG6_ACOGR|nr:hypothetical protein QJS04_geneDACA022878 [Acorus gramineus]
MDGSDLSTWPPVKGPPLLRTRDSPILHFISSSSNHKKKLFNGSQKSRAKDAIFDSED